MRFRPTYVTTIFFLVLFSLAVCQPLFAEPIPIGSRLEMFVDDYLIESLSGKTQIVLHQPSPRELVLVHDEPWEGTGSGYHSVFQDGSLYRMYYKAEQIGFAENKVRTDLHPLLCCYAESDDGIHWRKPNLGIHEFEGSKNNNIVMVSGEQIVSGEQDTVRICAGHPTVFKDDNPNAASDARYKATVLHSGEKGLVLMKSPDGIHFTPMSKSPILRGLGAFDSQNLTLWDPTLSKYRAYWRTFTKGTDEKTKEPVRYRAISTATSDDLFHWSEPVNLTYVDSPQEHLYTNQVKPYLRAPHILIGFPTRYIDRGWSESMESLPELEHRRMRASANQRFGTAITEGLLMVSRDGVKFKRYAEAFLPPGIERPGTWNYGQQYIAWGVVETESALKGAPRELSLYAGEDYWTGKGSALRRYSLRMDGFVSAKAPMSGGELLTKPIIFNGDKLVVNFATSAAGSLQVEIQDIEGKPIDGFALADCPPVFGDAIDRVVSWKDGTDVRKLAGSPVRLRWVLKDADLYAFQFRESEK